MFASAIKLAIGVAIVAIVAAQLVVQSLSHGRRAPDARSVDPVVAPKSASSSPASFGAGRGEVALRADRLGQYAADVEINGSRVHMLVDTGASSVALSYEDAAAVGFYPTPSEFKHQVMTANGVGRVAFVKLREVHLGSLIVHDVDAFVGERGAMSSSLLGMTFLAKLSHIEAGSGRLVLKQ